MMSARARQMVIGASMAAGLASAPSDARAFSEPRSYYDDPAEGGGGGRWFTGSPAEGYGCSVCHTGTGPMPLYIEGLPEDGYVPGATYDLRLSWPEFAARAQALSQTPGATTPAMGLIAELLAETGLGAGTIEIAASADATPGEMCSFPPDLRASQLYLVRSGEEVREEETRCEAKGLEERCIVAVSDCGAQELRMRWTAPDTWQRAIWFASGFVATEASSGSPAGDAVNEHAIPLRPAASESQLYESRLAGNCSAAPGARRANAAQASLVLAGVVALITRAFRGRGQR